MTANIEMNTNEHKGNVNQNGFPINMDSFTSKLRKEDEYNLRISKAFLSIYIGFIGVYGLIMVINLFTDNGLMHFISQACYMLSFIGFVLIFRNNLKIFNKIDYSLPMVEMLKAVVNRYQFRAKPLLFVLIPVLLMDGGLTLSFYEDLEPMSILNRILLIQAIYIPLMTISALVGVLIWYKTQKPLCDRANELIKEIENG